MGDLTTISLSKETKQKLVLLGNKGDTYDKIINNILNQLKETHKRELPKKLKKFIDK